jgi:hypothetical protein
VEVPGDIRYTLAALYYSHSLRCSTYDVLIMGNW